MMRKHNLLAAVLFAISVHFKTYPIIYAPSIYLIVNELYGSNVSTASKNKLRYVLSLLWPSDIAIVFAVVGCFITVGLAALFYDM